MDVLIVNGSIDNQDTGESISHRFIFDIKPEGYVRMRINGPMMEREFRFTPEAMWGPKGDGIWRGADDAPVGYHNGTIFYRGWGEMCVNLRGQEGDFEAFCERVLARMTAGTLDRGHRSDD